MRNILIATLGILLLISCSSSLEEKNEQTLVSLLEGAEDFKINYWRWTSKSEITTWIITFDTEVLMKVFKRAKPMQDKFLLSSYSYQGSYKKENQEFRISIRDIKNSSRPCVITIKQGNSFKQSFILEGELARKFLLWLDTKLYKSSKSLKGRVEKKR